MYRSVAIAMMLLLPVVVDARGRRHGGCGGGGCGGGGCCSGPYCGPSCPPMCYPYCPAPAATEVAPMPRPKPKPPADGEPKPEQKKGDDRQDRESRTPGSLEEVNALRAANGLPPYEEDPGLTQAAQSAAEYRASYGIEGHTQNDFAFIPQGSWATAAGCAAWEPSMGWGSCCTFEGWRYAGAAYAIGRDGRRYMHLYVR